MRVRVHARTCDKAALVGASVGACGPQEAISAEQTEGPKCVQRRFYPPALPIFLWAANTFFFFKRNFILFMFFADIV